LTPADPLLKMGSRVRRRRLVVLFAAVGVVLPGAASAAAPTPSAALQRKLAQALRVPHVSPARSAAVAFDLATGTTLYTQNATLSLAPASNEKLPLTYAALATLGPSYRIETVVLAQGEQIDSTWVGDLFLRGGGDPTLSSADLQTLALQVRDAGIRRVTGAIVGDESAFDARRTVAGWKPSFFIGESPPLSALVVDRARVGGYVTRSPALAAATAFRSALRKLGVAVTRAARVGRVDEYAYPIASVQSAQLWAILRFMDRESDNFTAEMLLKLLGASELDRGTSAAGAAVVTRSLIEAGIPMNGVRIVDGSGLSGLDRLTVDALTAMLRAAWTNFTIRQAFLAALPVAGVNGTLEGRLRRPPARGNVLAKTGTTREASALSGYVRTRYAFAVLQNGNPLSYWWARRAQDRFATVLAGQ
jgi:serine-type D-Ala-D-Ala carboxypeptidase/endopeptidase (penicillin-binding protein 4)